MFSHTYCKENGKGRHRMNETLDDLKRKREVVIKDIGFLFEMLQRENNERERS